MLTTICGGKFYISLHKIGARDMPQYKLRGHWLRIARFYMSDKGTGSDRDVTVIFPQASEIPDGWHAIGQKACPIHSDNAPSQPEYLVVQPHPDYFGEPLAEYVFEENSWEYVWGKAGKSMDFRLLRPKRVPDGYVSLSDWFGPTANQTFQNGKAPKAVALDCVIPVPIGTQIWNDVGSHARDDGSMWRSEGDEQAQWSFFRAQGNYDQPSGTGYKLNMALVEIV